MLSDVRTPLEFIRKKLEKEKADNHRRFEKAWKDFRQITAHIIEKYKAIRGSLLEVFLKET